MPKFAANLSMLFTEQPFPDRFEAAAKAGFKAVEFQFPYDHDAEHIRDRALSAGVQIVLHNLPAGDWDAGERGIGCLPDRLVEFRRGVAAGVAYAKTLGVTQLNCLAGKAPAGIDPGIVRQAFVDNLRFAAAELASHGIRLLIEPINTFDIPGCFLDHTAQALDIIDEVGSDNLYLQYDIYHMQRMEGELAATIEKHLPRIAHIQVADNPGRNEPGTGEINYHFLFRHLDRIGYGGWIGCEYKPRTTTREGLGWLSAV